MGKKGTEFNKQLLKKEYTENELIKNYNLIFLDKIKSLKDIEEIKQLIQQNEELKENINNIKLIEEKEKYTSPWAEEQQEQ